MTTSHPHFSEELKKLDSVFNRLEVRAMRGADIDVNHVSQTKCEVAALLAQSHQSAEAAVLEKLQPLLIDEPNMYDTFDWTLEKSGRNKLRAELRTALNPPKENDAPSASVAEVRRVREANEAFYKEHGHDWYEECDNYSIECHAPTYKEKI